MEGNEYNISTYSSGEHVLLRIHELWKKLHSEVSLNHYYQWDIVLDRIWCELINLMDDTEYKEYSEEILKIKSKILEVSPIVDNFEDNKGFDNIKLEEVKKIAKQYNVLMTKERCIRIIQRKVEGKVIKSGRKNWD